VTVHGKACLKRDEIRIHFVTASRFLFFMATTNGSRIVIIHRGCTYFPHHSLVFSAKGRFLERGEAGREVFGCIVSNWARFG
jgi:hypothetical protein